MIIKDGQDKGVIVLALIVAFIFFGYRYYKDQQEKKDSIVVEGVSTRIKPCLETIEEQFGNSIDANRACTCLLTSYFQLIKHNPEEVKKYKEIGYHALEGKANDSALQIYGKCMEENITDPDHRINLTEEFKQKMKALLTKQLKDSLAEYHLVGFINTDSFCNCVVDKISHITVKEYFTSNYSEVGGMDSLVKVCLGRIR